MSDVAFARAAICDAAKGAGTVRPIATRLRAFPREGMGAATRSMEAFYAGALNMLDLKEDR